MANITKRVNRKAAPHLAGETVEVAILVEPKGTYAAGGLATALMPRTQMRRSEAAAAQAQDEEGGMAQSFPAASCVVAITTTRVVAFESNGLTFRSLDFEAPRDAVYLASDDGVFAAPEGAGRLSVTALAKSCARGVDDLYEHHPGLCRGDAPHRCDTARGSEHQSPRWFRRR